MLMGSHEERLAALGVTLPPPFRDEANRVRALRSGNHIYMSGHFNSHKKRYQFSFKGRSSLHVYVHPYRDVLIPFIQYDRSPCAHLFLP
jgi:hypothetical protein